MQARDYLTSVYLAEVAKLRQWPPAWVAWPERADSPSIDHTDGQNVPCGDMWTCWCADCNESRTFLRNRGYLL